MKYETPELTALVPAINAIQTTSTPKVTIGGFDSPAPLGHNEGSGAYADWE